MMKLVHRMGEAAAAGGLLIPDHLAPKGTLRHSQLAFLRFIFALMSAYAGNGAPEFYDTLRRHAYTASPGDKSQVLAPHLLSCHSCRPFSADGDGGLRRAAAPERGSVCPLVTPYCS